MTIIEDIRDGSRLQGLRLEEAQCDLLTRYVQLVLKWNRVYSLTAIREKEKFISHHILDSLSVLPYLSSGSLLDVGTGPGFPGIPLAVADPTRPVTLLDSNHKKGAFLRQAKLELELNNVEIVTTRIETFDPDEKFGMAISRAFSDLVTFVEAAARLVKPDGFLLAMKGVYPDEEMQQLPSTTRVEKVISITIPGLDAARHLIILGFPVTGTKP